MKMPNSTRPIQRASSTCEMSANNALPTRTRKTLPATICASRLSVRSPRIAFTRAIAPPNENGGAGVTFSEPVSDTGSLRAGGDRGAGDGIAIVVA